MSEPFSIKKLLNVFEPSGYYKVIGLAIRAAAIALVIFGVLWVKNLLLPAPEIHKPVITGETVHYYEGSKRRIEFFAGPVATIDKDGDWTAGAFCGFKF